MKKTIQPHTQPWIFDAHQDIAIALMFTTRTNFFVKSGLKDGSNELGIPVNNQSDFPRLKAGNIHAVFGSSCAFSSKNGEIVPSKKPDTDTFDQINTYHSLVRRSEGKVFLIRTNKDLRVLRKDALGILLHVEGADMLVRNPESIETLYNLGVRSIGLTWNFRNGLAGGAFSRGRLTQLGKKVVGHMERMGIVVDLAHLNTQSAHDVLNIISRPFIISHTNCQSIFKHPRNVDERLLQRVSKKGGVVCISGVPLFLGDKPTVHTVRVHILHALQICGEDHVAVGSDFSVMPDKRLVPRFAQSSDFGYLVDVLREKMSEKVLKKICHENLMRVVTHVLKTS